MITQTTPGATSGPTAELEGLFQQAISPEQFYRRYLQLLSGRLPGAAGIHLWILQGGEFVPLGGSDRGPLRYDETPGQRDFLHARMQAAATGEQTLLVPAASEGNQCPFVLAVTPLLYGKGGGAVQGAQICWWPAGEMDRARSAIRILESFATFCARMVRAQRLESMTQISGQLQLMTQFLGELSASPDTRTLAVVLANRAREAADCDRCALVAVRPGGRLEVEAISNVPNPDPRSTAGRTLIQLADHARRTGLPALFRKAGEKTEERGDLSDYFYHSSMQEALVVAVQPAGEDLAGLLILESSQAGFFEPQRSASIGPVVAQAATPLHQALLREEMPLRDWMERIARWRRLPAEERKQWRRRRWWIPLAACAVAALFPVRLQFTGEARLLPQERALAVAQVDGRVVEVMAAAGDRVEEGQPLARLDDTELRKQAEIAAQEEARLLAEADRLLALNERAAAQVAQLELQRARREHEFHRSRADLAVIRSPIRGVVMTPELRSRQGDALQPGSHLAMVGDPSSWELEVNLPEADVAALLERLHNGAAVPVRFKLASIPQKTFATSLSGTDAVAAASEVIGGRNVFRIVIPLPPEPDYDNIFRAGYTGRARLVIGYRPLAYTALRRFFNWARTTVFF
jgi:biotin carboxyl carrier protein